jgi:hypothetical protein
MPQVVQALKALGLLKAVSVKLPQGLLVVESLSFHNRPIPIVEKPLKRAAFLINQEKTTALRALVPVILKASRAHIRKAPTPPNKIVMKDRMSHMANLSPSQVDLSVPF